MGFEDIEKLRKNREIKTTHNNGYNSALLPNFIQKQLTRFRLISTLDKSGGFIHAEIIAETVVCHLRKIVTKYDKRTF